MTKHVKLFENFLRSRNFYTVEEVEKLVIESSNKEEAFDLLRESKDVHGKSHTHYFLNEASENFYLKLEEFFEKE
jgi:hypothetical protein